MYLKYLIKIISRASLPSSVIQLCEYNPVRGLMGCEVKAVWCGVVEDRVEGFALVASRSILSSNFWRLSEENRDFQDELQGLGYNQLCDFNSPIKSRTQTPEPSWFYCFKVFPKIEVLCSLQRAWRNYHIDGSDIVLLRWNLNMSSTAVSSCTVRMGRR